MYEPVEGGGGRVGGGGRGVWVGEELEVWVGGGGRGVGRETR